MVPFSQQEGYAPKHPDVVAANPKGQVPMLLDQGLVMHDSTVILEYLEGAFPHPALYPREVSVRSPWRLDGLLELSRSFSKPAPQSFWISSDASSRTAMLFKVLSMVIC